jgi:hypothetical protein
MMLIEMASYVGDVLSFYIDNQIQENFLQFAKQRKNLLAQAYTFGYQPKVTKAASVVLSVYQVVPSTIASGQYEPDFNYALILEEGGKVSSNLDSNIQFFINEKLDFSKSTPGSETEISVYSTDVFQNPQFYLLKKTVKASAGTLTSTNITFGNPERYPTVDINDTNIIEIYPPNPHQYCDQYIDICRVLGIPFDRYTNVTKMDHHDNMVISSKEFVNYLLK